MEARPRLTAALLGSAWALLAGETGCVVRQGCEGRDEREVAGESDKDREEDVGTEVWACKSDSMLLLLALEGRDSVAE